MADDQATALACIDSFFLRSSLANQDKLDCYKFIEQLHPGEPISPAKCQGYCSLTLLVGEHIVIQFRPSKYQLDLQISETAKEIYGNFAPSIKYIATLPASGLLVYAMSRIEGVSLQDFRASNRSGEISTNQSARLCSDFAYFVLKGWQQRSGSVRLGTVGISMRHRLEQLSTMLPMRFRGTANRILMQLERIVALPWVLTHGDVVPTNLMVKTGTGQLSGLVDWAEAEYLPFGICIYGLEELLGEMSSTGFHYYPEAGALRNIFWNELINCIPELKQNTATLEAVKLSRDLGVLLWYGIAFDDGAINRVVQEGKDTKEILRLDAFLNIDEHGVLDKCSKI